MLSDPAKQTTDTDLNGSRNSGNGSRRANSSKVIVGGNLFPASGLVVTNL
jgi:hypothetical protein